MRAAYCIAAGISLFAGSALFGQSAAPRTKPEKRRTIYLTIKGPEESAAKLRASFTDAALSNDLFIAEDPHRAGSKIDITIADERKVDWPLYAELLTATLVPRQGDSSTISFCKQVSDGAGYTTVTTSYWMPNEKSVPAHSAIWVEAEGASRSLAEILKKRVGEAGFQIAASAKDADLTLKDIRLSKVPLQGMAVEAKVQSVLNMADGSMTTLSTNIKSYLSIAEPISPEAEGCRSTVHHVIDLPPPSYSDVAAIDMALIMARIRK